MGVCDEGVAEELGPEGKGFVREGLFEGDESVPLSPFGGKVNRLVILGPLYQGGQSGRELPFENGVGHLIALRRRRRRRSWP